MAQKSLATKMTGYVLEALGSLSATDLYNLCLLPHSHPPMRPTNLKLNNQSYTSRAQKTGDPKTELICKEALPHMIQDYNPIRPK